MPTDLTPTVTDLTIYPSPTTPLGVGLTPYTKILRQTGYNDTSEISTVTVDTINVHLFNKLND